MRTLRPPHRFALPLALGLLCPELLAPSLKAQEQPPIPQVCAPDDVLPDEATSVYVYGQDYTEDTVIGVEGVGDLLTPTFVSSELIAGYVPPLDPANPNQPPGWKTITARNRSGGPISFLPNGVRYVQYDEPYLIECEPKEVGPGGGTLIHFYGRRLRAGLVPAFEGVPCTDPILVSDREITALSPPLEPRERFNFYTGELTEGPGGPTVTRRVGALAVYADTVPPAITSVEPLEVDARGGSAITIRGDHLRNDVRTAVNVYGPGGVLVGGVDGRTLAADYLPVDAIEGVSPRINPLDPATPLGLHDIVYSDPRGESILRGALRYLDHIRAVSPSEVTANEITDLVFEGYGFEVDWVPRIGGVACTDIVHESAERMTARAPSLQPGTYDVDMTLPDGNQVVASTPQAITVVPSPAVEAEKLLGPSEGEGALAEGVARFEWTNPVEPVSLRVLDASGTLLDRLPGDTRLLMVPVSALLDQVPLFLQSEFANGKVSNVIQIVARRSGCDRPPPLTGIDRRGDVDLVLFGGNALGEPGRCDAMTQFGPIPDLGGLELLQLRQTSFSAQRGGGAAGLLAQASLISDYTRSRIEAIAQDPSLKYVRRLATSQFTGFRLDRDADKLQIDAFYAMPIFAFDLRLKGRLIHAFPQDGFHDTFTFPEILPSGIKRRNGVTYFRADRDVLDPAAASCGQRIPAGEYILELYAEGGDPGTPHFLLDTDGRNEEIVIPGVPCPPYPRVQVTDLTGLRSLPVITKITGVEVPSSGLTLSPTIQLTAHGYWVDESGVEHSLSEADVNSPVRKYVPYNFRFQWKVYDSQNPTVRTTAGSNQLVTQVKTIGCYSVDLRVTDPDCDSGEPSCDPSDPEDPDCPRNVARSFEVVIFPRTFQCNAPFYSVINPVPDTSSVTGVVGFRTIPAGLCEPPRRKESFKVFVVPQGCCLGDINCPAAQLGDLEFRLQSGGKAVYAIPPAAVEDLCAALPKGPKYLKVTVAIDDVDLLPGGDAGNFVDVWLEARTLQYRDPDRGGLPISVQDSWHPIGQPMRLTNRPAAMNANYSRVSYSRENSSYQVVLQASRDALNDLGAIPSTRALDLFPGVPGAMLPSFPSSVDAGMSTALQIVGAGGWKPLDTASTMAGEVLGGSLDGLPSRVGGLELPRSVKENLEWSWSETQTLLDTSFQQRLFNAILFTGPIGPIPVTIWGSVSLALKIQLIVAANVKITPFAPILDGGSYFQSQIDFRSKLGISLPAELRTDILFGIASLALSFEVGATSNFDATLRAINTNLDTFLRLYARLDIKLAAKLCLFWFLCLPKLEIPLLEETIVDHSDPPGWAGSGGGGALASNEVSSPDAAGSGGAGDTVTFRELLTVPAAAVSPDGSQLFKLFYNRQTDVLSATLSTLNANGTVREENIAVGATELLQAGPVDFSAAYLRNDRVLIAVGATYREEASVPLPIPADVLPPREQLNELKAQDEVVLCRLGRGVANGGIDSIVFRLADPIEEVSPADRRADGRPSIAGNAPFEDAIVAWVRFESRDFIVDDASTTTVYTRAPGGSFTGSEVATSLCNLRSTAIYARTVDFDGVLGPPRKISTTGINVQPTVAFSPDGGVAYCVWLNDPTHADLTRSNRGRNLLYSVWARATDSWSDPQPVLEQPDDFPGAMEPSLALRGPGRGILVFNALSRGADVLDTGLNGSNRYAFLVRLEDGQFGAPVQVHGVCAQRLETRYMTIHVDPLQEPRVGPLDPGVRFSTPGYFLVGQQTGALGHPESSGNILVAAVREESLGTTVAAPLLDDNRTHTNVVGAVWAAGINTLNLKGGLAQVDFGAGAGAGLDDIGYESIPLGVQPDLAVVACKLTDRFPGPGARVTATVEVENRGLAGSAMDSGGNSLCSLRIVFTRVDGTETIEAEEPLPILMPGVRTTVEATLEMPLDPVRLRAEITPNPGDRDPSNDGQSCFFGAPRPLGFRCEILEAAHASGDWLVELGWESPIAFDEVLLWRDGIQLAALPGSETVFVDSGATPGPHLYEIRGRVGVSKSSRVRLDCEVLLPPGGTFRRGDVDGNNVLDITDAIRILGFLFLGSAAPPCADAADADDNGKHEITDAIRILGYLFLGSAPPPAPGPHGCGPDPTADSFPDCDTECQG